MKQHTSKTRQELLNNTVNYFNSENRGYNGSICSYTTSDGKACAIGIEVKPSLRVELERVGRELNSTGICEVKLFNLLPKRLQSMGQDFLSAIQRLHDGDIYWNEGGITKSGRMRVQGICNEYNLENPCK